MRSLQAIYSKSLKHAVDQIDLDAVERDGSLSTLFLGELTATATEPKYRIPLPKQDNKENANKENGTENLESPPLPPTWGAVLSQLPTENSSIPLSIAARSAPLAEKASLLPSQCKANCRACIGPRVWCARAHLEESGDLLKVCCLQPVPP